MNRSLHFPWGTLPARISPETPVRQPLMWSNNCAMSIPPVAFRPAKSFRLSRQRSGDLVKPLEIIHRGDDLGPDQKIKNAGSQDLERQLIGFLNVILSPRVSAGKEPNRRAGQQRNERMPHVPCSRGTEG